MNDEAKDTPNPPDDEVKSEAFEERKAAAVEHKAAAEARRAAEEEHKATKNRRLGGRIALEWFGILCAFLVVVAALFLAIVGGANIANKVQSAFDGTAGMGGAGANQFEYRPEVFLPALLVLALVALIGALVIAARSYRSEGSVVTNQGDALGLPDGSVRAILALGLILIFAILVVYLYNDVSQPFTAQSLGVPAEDIKALPSVVSVEPSTAADGSRVYSVTMATPKSADSNRFALQVLTTISTLAVAVAAFYFGSRTGESAPQALETMLAHFRLTPAPDAPAPDAPNSGVPKAES